jgi:hypothetical protein
MELPQMAQWMPVLALGAALLFAGCGDPKDAKPAATVPGTTSPAQVAINNARDPQWVVQANPHNNVAVVFVHGLFGGTLDTWTQGDGKPSFFDVLRSVPGAGQQVDMYAFGFTSKMFGPGSLDIREAASKLHQNLEFSGVLAYRTIVMVGHSMGGLVILRELVNNRDDIQTKVPLVVLYASPQEGAQIAQIAAVVAHNPALAEMFGADNNAFLQQLDEDWRNVRNKAVHPHVTCGYEKLPTHGVMIVPWSSATRFCDEAGEPIEGADHITIVKPDRQQHGSIVLLVNALKRYGLPDPAGRLDTPDFVPEGDHVVFNLDDPLGKSPARLVNAGRMKVQYTLSEISRGLYVWPDDTPKDIPGAKTETIKVGLGFGATDADHAFVLQSDLPSRQRVIVRISDLASFKAKQKELASQIDKDVANYFADPINRSALAGVPANDPRAAEALAGAVAESVAKQSPGLPQQARWVIAADYLTAANLPRVAASALRRAEAVAPSSAKSSSVQWLGGVVAAQSGQASIFQSTTTPTLTTQELQAVRYAGILSKGSSDKMAAQLKDIPALTGYGLSLEGDLHRVEGNKEAAKAAYSRAASIQKSPWLDYRIETLNKGTVAFDKNATFEDNPAPAFTPKTAVTIDQFKGKAVQLQKQ